MTDNTSFFNMVNASTTLSERWVKVAGEVVTAAREMFGVQLDHEDVASLTAVRTCVLGAHDLDDYMTELSALKKVKDRVPTTAKTKVESAQKTEAGVSQRRYGTGDAAHALAEERDAMRRFAEARAAGLPPPEDAAKHDPANMSDVEKIRFLMAVPDRARRMALARDWNLTGL